MYPGLHGCTSATSDEVDGVVAPCARLGARARRLLQRIAPVDYANAHGTATPSGA